MAKTKQTNKQANKQNQKHKNTKQTKLQKPPHTLKTDHVYVKMCYVCRRRKRYFFNLQSKKKLSIICLLVYDSNELIYSHGSFTHYEMLITT